MSMRSATVLLASAAATSSVASADDFPFDKPQFRFEPFDKLSEASRNVAEDRLGYRETTWNVHGLADVESSGWSYLTSGERDGAVLLGFNENTWDCFVNHYEENTWDDLAARGVQEHFEGLGWSRAHWEHTTDEVPYTEARWWEQLTDKEKGHANQLCYFIDNWNRIDMNPNPTYFPHPFPAFRYRPWDDLDTVTQNVAGGMMNYTEELWNKLGTSINEKNTFLNLKSEPREAALELGFYTHTWDCFMNHYLTYYWSSLHGDLKVAVETLGWTEAMWRGEEGAGKPQSEETVWNDLTPQEKGAATRLCYFKETWDGDELTRWYDYENEVHTASGGTGPVPEDIDLDIFTETGYVGQVPEAVTGEMPGEVVVRDRKSVV